MKYVCQMPKKTKQVNLTLQIWHFPSCKQVVPEPHDGADSAGDPLFHCEHPWPFWEQKMTQSWQLQRLQFGRRGSLMRRISWMISSAWPAEWPRRPSRWGPQGELAGIPHAGVAGIGIHGLKSCLMINYCFVISCLFLSEVHFERAPYLPPHGQCSLWTQWFHLHNM